MLNKQDNARKETERSKAPQGLKRSKPAERTQSIRSKVQAGEENVHEDKSLILQSKEIDLGACFSTKPNCTATGFTEAEKCVNVQDNARKETKRS